MADILKTVSTRRTPQSQKADPRQVKNAAGGYSFQVGDWERLHRFLTLGTEGGTYYTKARDLTEQNAQVVYRCVSSDSVRVVNEIISVSEGGRAPRQNPAIFALAIAASISDDDGRRAALAAIPRVCRTGTTLFQFIGYVQNFRGWGRGLRKAIAGWYLDKPVDRVAYQAVKYRQREGFTGRDVLRLAHPYAGMAQETQDVTRKVLFDWMCGHEFNRTEVELPAIVEAYLDANSEGANTHGWVNLIQRGVGLSWEMLPDAALKEKAVWEALLDQGMPQTALLRQLPRLTNLGLATGDWGRKIAAQLSDTERLKKARVHPINVLVAARTYAQGHGERGRLSWSPSHLITGALNDAFYNAYQAVEPANKRTLLACDVSGSMSWGSVSGLPLQPREVCGALACVIANTERDYHAVGFTTQAWPLDISPQRRLDDVLSYLARQPSGGTDCSSAIQWATRNRVEVDTIITLTDGESWAGRMHPFQAMRQYRERTGINARMISVAMTATGTSITDLTDPLSMDVVGFDTSTPQLITNFSRGDI